MNIPAVEIDKDEIALKGQRIYDQNLRENWKKSTGARLLLLRLRQVIIFWAKEA